MPEVREPAILAPLDGTIALDGGEEAGPVPARFVAVTVNVYDVPLISPLTVTGGALPLPENPPGKLVAV